jgi:transposase
MNNAVVYVGVDVAKAYLDVAWAERSRRFANGKSGWSALIKWIKQSALPAHLICEASGGYERGLLDAAEQNGLKLSLVQANRVRQYARAAGILAKTDKVDARVLCAFGRAMQPEPTLPLSVQQKQLRELETQRRHLSRMLVAEQNRLAQLNDKELQRLTRCLLASLKKQMALIDARLAALIAQDQTLREKAQKLTAIAGVGRRTAVLLLAQMPELGTLNRAQTAAGSPAWLHLTATAAPCGASAPSSEDVALCVAASTWPHWWLLVIIVYCAIFISVSVPTANLTKSLSLL